MEHSTEAGISSDHHQYPKLREETFIRVSGESSTAERTPGKSVIPYSLYWNLLKSLIPIFSWWLHLSFPAAGVLHRVFVGSHLYAVSHLLLEDLRAKIKASFLSGNKMPVDCRDSELSISLLFSVWILKLTILPRLVAHVPAWTRCQQNCTVPPQSCCPAAFASAAAAGGNILNHG